MIIADVNILIHAYGADSPYHQAAVDWFRDGLQGDETIAVTDSTVTGFLRITTNRRAFSLATSIEDSVAFVDSLIASGALFVSAGKKHWDAMKSIALTAHAHGDLVSDAHLAAVALEHGARVATRDRDFARFPGVDWFDPLD